MRFFIFIEIAMAICLLCSTAHAGVNDVPLDYFEVGVKEIAGLIHPKSGNSTIRVTPDSFHRVRLERTVNGK